MKAVFWISVLVILYTYFGYPLLLKILCVIRNRPVRKGPIAPRVSLIVPVYNEEKWIGKKIENLLGIDYPKERIEIVVISDGSTDSTDEIIQGMNNGRIKFIRQEARQGKTRAQNKAVKSATGDILVFTDASTQFDSEAFQSLLSNFNDPSVGLVSGEDYWYEEKSDAPAATGHGLYVTYEMVLRRCESRIGSSVNASGCFYGVRRALVSQLQGEVVDDLALPLDVVRKGYRVVTEKNAIAKIPETASPEMDFQRRIRITVGGLNSFFRNLDLLNPLRYGFFSWQLVSHKLLRWLVPFFLILALLSNCLLLGKGIIPLYGCLLAAQLGFYALALRGYRRGPEGVNGRFLRIPFYFFSSNLSIAVAWIKLAGGEKFEVWEPSRS